ncbi:relaxase/mobilization nuclease domain-containing protein [Caulobacter sp. Root1455]|uniref:relaxase/mobilization nuclease domain-containing protein n=2 Tax=unclassified Caulobacter TaxID=2648921 RepID=UPI000AD9A8E0|nr:hypothetical protein [Caulobacter sp. Root1455]
MSDFRDVGGFDQVWRAPAGGRKIIAKGSVLGGPTSGGGEADAKAKLARVVQKAPEVMVKITGKTKDGEHLGAHLDYISRKGELDLEQSDGAFVHGRDGVKELALDWAASGESDSRRRANSTMSVSIVLSMPVGTDPERMKDAVRAFARAEFGETYPYVFAFHQDAKGEQPHVHLSVRSLGVGGERLNPKKADLADWRERFASELRGRGIEAEATPRRARGITQKPERTPVRKARERFERTGQNEPRVLREARREAESLARSGGKAQPWDDSMRQRQAQVRSSYRAAAKVLEASVDPRDQALGRSVEAFVKAMPAPVSRRVTLARTLVEGGKQIEPAKAVTEKSRGPGKDRSRGR